MAHVLAAKVRGRVREVGGGGGLTLGYGSKLNHQDMDSRS